MYIVNCTIQCKLLSANSGEDRVILSFTVLYTCSSNILYRKYFFRGRACLHCHRKKVLWLWNLTVLLTTRPRKQKGDCWCGSAYSHSTYTRWHNAERIENFKRARLSCGRMIPLHAHPLTPSTVSKLALFLSHPICRRSSLLAGKGGRGRVESNRPKESLALYKWFNTLWRTACRKNCCSPHISLLPTNTFLWHCCKNIEN
jgi:hypothetical protein